MNGKGSGRRPAAKDKPNAYQDNFDKIFGKREKKKETKDKKPFDGSPNKSEFMT